MSTCSSAAVAGPCSAPTQARRQEYGGLLPWGVARARSLLRRHRIRPPTSDDPRSTEGDALATALMELFRRSGSAEAFELLVRLTRPALLQRVRRRTRFLPTPIDPEEVLQDALVNIYRYPDRFDGRRSGAFKAWASTIVDNAVRRRMRRGQKALAIRLQPCELLAQEPDVRTIGPDEQAEHTEAGERILGAWRLFLLAYLAAFETLADRERFVLHMVEVNGRRYAEVAALVGIRAEALKMVVFRARRRLYERMSELLAPRESGLIRAAG